MNSTASHVAARPGSATRAALALGGVSVVLLVTAPSPAVALRTLADLPQAADPNAPLLAVVGLAAWALVAWLAAGALLVVAGHLPGLSGSLASAVAVRTVPVAFRRTVEVALGACLALGTVGAPPATAATSGPGTAPVAAANLDWPTAAVVPAAPAPQSAVVVRPGDTLWGLAGQALRAAGPTAPSDAAIAAAWPAWWAANREAVGDDPDLLLPGTALVAPPASS